MVDRDELQPPPDDFSIAGEEKEERAGELDRLISLSDGVFAFAMTLLIVSVAVPQMSDDDARIRLHHDIVDLWPEFLAHPRKHDLYIADGHYSELGDDLVLAALERHHHRAVHAAPVSRSGGAPR